MKGFDSQWLADREGASAEASAGLDPLADQAVRFVESLGAEPILVVAYAGDYPTTNDLWSSPHWTVRKKLRDDLHDRTPATAPVPESEWPVWAWYVAMGRRLDADGATLAGKCALDALVKGRGVLPDDNTKYVSLALSASLPKAPKGFAVVLSRPFSK